MTTKHFFSFPEKSLGVSGSCLLLILILTLGLTACGIKKDPVPIAEPNAAAITDLAHSLKDEMVTLTWTLPEGEQFRSHVAGFVVYKSKEEVKQERCQGCPILFTPVADIPAGVSRAGSTSATAFTFSEPVEKGFRYAYKVTVYLKSGTASNDSNLVEFTY